jgi:hypothetical protein
VNFWQGTRRLSSPNRPTLQFGPCGLFFLFPKLKSTLKRRRFQTIEEIEEISLWGLCAIPQNAFQDAFQNWEKCWERCINSGGDYFEGDKSYYVVSLSINVKKKFGFFLDSLRNVISHSNSYPFRIRYSRCLEKYLMKLPIKFFSITEDIPVRPCSCRKIIKWHP